MIARTKVPLLFVASDSRELAPWVAHWTNVRPLALPVHWARSGTWKNRDVIAIANGVGTARAAAAVQAAAANHKLSGIFSVGTGGALDPTLSIADIIVATAVTDNTQTWPALDPRHLSAATAQSDSRTRNFAPSPQNRTTPHATRNPQTAVTIALHTRPTPGAPEVPLTPDAARSPQTDVTTALHTPPAPGSPETPLTPDAAHIPQSGLTPPAARAPQASPTSATPHPQTAPHPPARLGLVRTVPHIARTTKEKQNLSATGAILVEMESAGVAQLAHELAVPFHCVRVVSDLATETFFTDFDSFLTPDGRFSVPRLMLHAIAHPVKGLGEMLRLQKRTAIGAKQLGIFLAACEF